MTEKSQDPVQLRKLLRNTAAHWSADHKVILEIFALQNTATPEQESGLQLVIDLLMKNISGNGPLERAITKALGDSKWNAYHPEWDRGKETE